MAQQLWLPSFISSGMILQQQTANILRGRTRPATAVSLVLERQPFDCRPVSPLDKEYGNIFECRITSNELGYFEFKIPPFTASYDPISLFISDGFDSLLFKDILFGEIWLCAGQSNMQMPLAACASAKVARDQANLFFVRVLSQTVQIADKKKSSFGFLPHEDLCGAIWRYGDQPDGIANISAIGFSFAREIHLDLKVPIGLIEIAVESTHIHSWLSSDSAEKLEFVKNHINETGFLRSKKDWNQTAERERICQQPSAVFNSMIAPLRGLGARGILWHHGNSDFQYPKYYSQVLPTMIRDWQQIFHPADKRGLGFLTAQIEPYFSSGRHCEQISEFNEMLSSISSILSNPAAVVPIYDLPPDYAAAPQAWRNPMHPTTKLPIGHRLKTVAKGLIYQLKAPISAPYCSGIEFVGGKVMLGFENIGDGLRLKGENSRLCGFAICGPDRVFVEAQCRILFGVKVLVWHDQITDPEAVTYAYADLNFNANLISRDNLPVLPFRSDNVPSVYCPPREWIHCEDLQIWCTPDFANPLSAGWNPAWLVESGQGEIKLEKAIKNEGDGSLHFKYAQPGRREFAVEPILDYASLLPPLNLSFFRELTIDVFNPDQQTKFLRLDIAAGSEEALLENLLRKHAIVPALRWQRMTFDLTMLSSEKREAIRRLVFVIEDKKEKGNLYLDQIRLVR